MANGLCPKCNEREKAPNSGYCRECRSAYNKHQNLYGKVTGAERMRKRRESLTPEQREAERTKARNNWNNLPPDEHARRNALHKEWFTKIPEQQLSEYRQARNLAEKNRVAANRDEIMSKRKDDYHERQKYKDSGKCTMSHSCNEPLAGTTKFCLKHWLVNIAAAAARNISPECEVSRVDYMELLELWNSQKGLCAISGLPLVPGDGASLDHIKPSSRGGDNSIENLRFIYQTINRIKADMTDDEFKPFLLKYWLPVVEWAKKSS